MGEEYKVKSLAKAMKILECFTLSSPELGITDISNRTGIQKSSVHNMLSTFLQLGYIKQNPQTEKYSLGLNLLHFSFSIVNNLKIRQIFLPYIMQITNKTGQICMLAVPHESKVFYIDASVSPTKERGMRHLTGEQAPFYCTALGKAMLAFMPSEKIEEYLATEHMVKYTDYTLTDCQHLRDQLVEIRRNGYAVDNMEHEYGIRCVAIPIFGYDLKIVAAISITGVALDFDSATIGSYASYMKEVISPVQNHVRL